MQSGINEMKNNSYVNFEEKLSKMIKPVIPNPDFLVSLKTKLVQAQSTIVETSKRNIGLMIFGAGLIAGAVALGIIGLIKKDKK